MDLNASITLCQGLLWEDAPATGQCFIYCQQDKDFIVLELVEYELWKEIVKGGQTLQGLADVMADLYGHENPDILMDIIAFVGMLNSKGIAI